MLLLLILLTNATANLLPSHENGVSSEISAEIYLSQCAHRALEDVIDKCASGGVELLSPSMRKKLAVGLSVCEFQDASIDYPDSCKHLVLDTDYHECVQELRSTSQFWTTYSGNYRKIKTICHEEAMPFFKEHIINLFNNVTRMYTSFYENSYKSTQTAEEYQNKVRKQFNDLLVEFSDVIITTRKERADLEEDALDFRKSMALIYEDVQEQADNELSNMSQALKSVNDGIVEHSTALSTLNSEEMNLYREMNSLWKDFKLQLLQDIFDIGGTIEETHQQLKYCKETQSDLQNSLEAGLALSSEFQYKLRAMTFELQRHLEDQNDLFEESLNILFSRVEFFLNESLLQVNASLTMLLESAYTITDLMREGKDAFLETALELGSEIRLAISEARQSSIFNPLRLLSGILSASYTMIAIVIAFLTLPQLLPILSFIKANEFVRYFFVGSLGALLLRMVLKP